MSWCVTAILGETETTWTLFDRHCFGSLCICANWKKPSGKIGSWQFHVFTCWLKFWWRYWQIGYLMMFECGRPLVFLDTSLNGLKVNVNLKWSVCEKFSISGRGTSCVAGEVSFIRPSTGSPWCIGKYVSGLAWLADDLAITYKSFTSDLFIRFRYGLSKYSSACSFFPRVIVYLNACPCGDNDPFIYIWSVTVLG